VIISKTTYWAGALGVSILLLNACSDKPNATTAAAPDASASVAPGGPAIAANAGASAPAISVTTVRAQQRDLPIVLKATGAVVPLSSVDVKSQVTSMVTRVHFTEGQFVRKGELLFTLDARADEANVAKARAQLVKDQAALSDAQRQLARAKDLLAQNFISKAALDTNQTLVDSQAAVLVTDQAAIDVARVSLSNATIIAPSAGRVGSINVFPGSGVQANVTTLVTITQLHPIAVAFSLPQRNLPDALAALQNGGAAVNAMLPEAAGSLAGHLSFVDNAVDASAGTIKVKAVFDNQQTKLWPGAFTEVTLTVRTIKDAVVVPQAAIIQGARGSIVYVAQDGKALLRPVQVLQTEGADAVVSGVKAGEAIVLDGKQNLRPDAKLVERAANPAVAKPASGNPPEGKASEGKAP
jgi:RND family efflux transporter MFP subunit